MQLALPRPSMRRKRATAPAEDVPPSPLAESPFVKGCRQALQIVEAILTVFLCVILAVLFIAGIAWLVDLLTGRRDDR